MLPLLPPILLFGRIRQLQIPRWVRDSSSPCGCRFFQFQRKTELCSHLESRRYDPHCGPQASQEDTPKFSQHTPYPIFDNHVFQEVNNSSVLWTLAGNRRNGERTENGWICSEIGILVDDRMRLSSSPQHPTTFLPNRVCGFNVPL